MKPRHGGRGARRGAALHVRRARGVELRDARDGVVEVGDDVDEARRGQVGERVLEVRERAGRLERLSRLGDHVHRVRARDEGVETPRARVGDDFQRAAALRADVLRHAADVRHHGVGVEDVRVDALEDVRRPGRAVNLERVVDMPAAVARRRDDVLDAHPGQHLAQLVGGVFAA